MKQNLFVRAGRPLVSKVAYKGNLRESIEVSVSLIGGIKKLVKKGELREPNLILASGNQVAIDVEGVKILQRYPGNGLAGKNVWDLMQIKHAIELGLGPRNEEEYEVVMP